LSEKSYSKLIINIKVSYLALALLSTVHLGAGLLLLAVPLPPPVRIVFWLALMASLILSARRHGWRAGTGAVTGLELDGDGRCALRYAQARDWCEGGVIRAVAHPWTVLLTLRLHGRRWPVSLWIPADAVDADAFRRLRARLRLESRAG